MRTRSVKFLQFLAVHAELVCDIAPAVVDLLEGEDRLDVLARRLGEDGSAGDISLFIAVLQELQRAFLIDDAVPAQVLGRHLDAQLPDLLARHAE